LQPLSHWEVFGLAWHHDIWLPLFQWQMPSQTGGVATQRVVTELGSRFDGWEIASWFVQPNSCLAGKSPIECLGDRLPDVLKAAREDRFVVC
jgi:hypothetical protein